MSRIMEEKVLQAIDDYQYLLFTRIEQLVSFKTVSPPARNTGPMQKEIARLLEQSGFNVKSQSFHDSDMLVSGTLSGYNSSEYNSLLINGHIDTATVTGQDWETDPFSVTRKDNQLIARGVSDMKGAMACFLYLFDLFKMFKVELPGDLKFQSVVGEEAGEAGTKKLLEQGEKADFAIVGDTSDLQIQGQGGVITAWITLKSPITYHDGNRVNMVAAGGGVKAASMVEKMVVVINALQTLEHYWAVTKKYPGFKVGMDTINPSFIEGGINPAFVADEAKLWITVHFYPNESVENIKREVENQVLYAAKADPWLRVNLPNFSWGGESMLIDKGEIFPPLIVDESSKAVQLLKYSHEKEMGNAPVISMSTTVTDGDWFDSFSIPCVIYGPGAMTQAHTNNEQVSFNQLLSYTKIIFRFIWLWCNSKKI